MVTGAANQDLIITLTATNGSNLSMTISISSLPPLGSLYQFAGGLRGSKISTLTPLVSDSANRLSYAPVANGFGAPYIGFSFTANDSSLDSLPAMVTINLLPPLRPKITTFNRSPAGSAQLTFLGHSNTTYCVWASSNLTTWEFVGAPIQTTSGSFHFLDSNANAFPQRFYRISTECDTPPPLAVTTGLTASGHQPI